ncbi:MAG: tRNA 2-thiouridine(34) synthase MnmA [Sandaracinaceae bacterium]|nr:tRNA 2-thiouridine(34) synthase MnmA [Sandaracinaceae bacterium]
MSGGERVLVAMSGGVDSSVAAALLKEAGHDLVGVTLHLWDASGGHAVGRCCAPEDREDARRTCDHLGIPHYVLDERRAFRERVVDPFVAGYLAGTTPSPCVHCNQEVKLGRLLEIARDLGATRVATGHYARITRDASNAIRLHRGHDREKDQSYFLYGVPLDVLDRCMFPLGELRKGQTREEGRRLGVPNWDKKDSQELCFVPDGDVGGFIERETGVARTGEVVDASGEVLGHHDGVYRFTVGQRRGLGIGGGAPPRYVLKILPDEDRVVVGDVEDLAALTAHAQHAVWTGASPAEPFEAEVQVRYRHRAAPARVTPTPEGFAIAFHEPARAIAPGQAAVVYRGDQVIGGGLLAV